MFLKQQNPLPHALTGVVSPVPSSVQSCAHSLRKAHARNVPDPSDMPSNVAGMGIRTSSGPVSLRNSSTQPPDGTGQELGKSDTAKVELRLASGYVRGKGRQRGGGGDMSW